MPPNNNDLSAINDYEITDVLSDNNNLLNNTINN